MRAKLPRSLYIHIPFCEVKCGYCDFYSVPRGYEDFDLQQTYVDALIREIEKRSSPFSGRSVTSIFFGGGTPSLLAPDLLEKILRALERQFSWDKRAEITLEANPKTVSREKLANFRTLGINRLSIGVQSFQDRFLKALGRIHNADEARRTIDDARAVGFENVGLDLIYALPGQSLEEWKLDLEEAIALGTPHLSAYHLTIESGTPFDGLRRGGRLDLPTEEVGVSCLTWTRSRLYQVHVEPYEISNFSRPGFESVHNLNYWRYGEYLGFGTAAASFIKTPKRMRSTNVRDLKKYIEGHYEDFTEDLSGPTAMGEFCMLALRTREGIEGKRFCEEFEASFLETFTPQVKRWVDRGWMEAGTDSWRLTEAGILFADEVACSFLP